MVFDALGRPEAAVGLFGPLGIKGLFGSQIPNSNHRIRDQSHPWSLRFRPLWLVGSVVFDYLGSVVALARPAGALARY